jgi:dihydroorotate dehydrogenase (fumarate)
MVVVHRISVTPPLVNASCVWSSHVDQLRPLFASPFTGAVTTRTATLNGFDEDQSNTVAFSSHASSSLNSYGYSPHPLAAYLAWVDAIIASDAASSKPFIISITSSSPATLSTMLHAIQALRAKLDDAKGTTSRIAVELNTSCPNIPGSSPPSYDFPSLIPLLTVLADHFRNDNTLTIGLKLPPYIYAAQFDDVIRIVSSFSDPTTSKNPFAFFTSTNTLGSSLLFTEQTSSPNHSMYALPPVLGGLAGDSIHPLSLGNVYTFARLLASASDLALRNIVVIGVGGVTSPEAVSRMHRAGAAVVGCATLLGKEGVAAFQMLSGV